MEKLTFRPLRLIKQTGKITVSSYMVWRKIKTSGNRGLLLLLSEEYKDFDPDAFVHDRNGNQLFFFNDPYRGHGLDVDDVPCFSHYTIDYITAQYKDMNQFDPLTVKVVRDWLGRFLYSMENITLI